MECPRCDEDLEAYRLGGREAVICRDCGYVGIETDLHPESTEVESWSEAIQRFRENGTRADSDGSDESGPESD